MVIATKIKSLDFFRTLMVFTPDGSNIAESKLKKTSWQGLRRQSVMALLGTEKTPSFSWVLRHK